MSFRKRLRTVAWLDKTVDLLVVILGITIAFGIDNWAEARRNEQTERKYLRSLQADLRKDATNLTKLEDQIGTVLYNIHRIKKLWGDKSNADSVGFYVSKVGGLGVSFDPEDYTYQALQQSGDISLLENDTLRLTLSQLYDSYERNEEQEEVADEMMSRYLIDFFENYDQYNDVAVNPEVYNSHRFRFGISVYESNLHNRRSIINRILQRIDKARHLIEESVP